MEKENKKELEEKVEKLEKSNNIMKGLLTVLGVAILVSACLGLGIIVGDKLDEKEEIKDENKQEEKEETKDDKEEELELEKLTKDSAVVKKLFEVFREDQTCTSNGLWDDFNDADAKKYIAYNALDASSFVEVKCGNLDDSYNDGHYCAMNDEAMKYYGVNETKYEDAIKNETTSSVTEAVLEAKYKELFGKDSVMEKGSFYIGEGPIAYYDKVNKIYADFYCECGGDCAGIRQTLDSITQDGMSLVLYTTTVSNADENHKKVITYTFEYEKETGNYIFVSRKVS